MKLIEGQIIEGETVRLDNAAFIDCTLIDCTLGYSGTDISFERTELRGCRYVFFGHARQTLHFLQGKGLMPFDSNKWGEFPLVN